MYSQWSLCTGYCGQQEKHRDAFCVSSQYCSENKKEIRMCNLEPCSSQKLKKVENAFKIGRTKNANDFPDICQQSANTNQGNTGFLNKTFDEILFF